MKFNSFGYWLMVESNQIILKKIEKKMNGGKQKQINQKKKLKSCGKPQTQLMNQYIALYCEMVGIGIGGKEHMVARVSIVNQVGDVLIDKFVKPQHPVRTRFNSICTISNVLLFIPVGG